MRAAIVDALAVASITLVAIAGERVYAKAHSQQLFVVVRDSSGRPIRDLSAADFEVTEGGQPRRVTHAVAGSTVHSRVAVLLDNGFLTGGTVTPIRTALGSLVTSLSPEDDVALGMLSPQFRIRVKPTTDRKELLGAINTLFATTTTGTALVDGVVEMDDRFVKAARDRWSVFVIITSDSPEVSGRQIEEFNGRIREFVQRGARAHVVLAAYSSQARGNEPEMCLALTRSTGGTYEAITTITSLPDKMKAIAARIADAERRASEGYVIEFTRESDTAPIDVSAHSSGATVTVSMAP